MHLDSNLSPVRSKQASEVARDLRNYAGGVSDGAIAAKLLAAAAEIDDRHAALNSLRDGN